MLSNETTKSYIWLLRCFLKAFSKQPRLVVTDQDPAMRKAIAAVFKESKHRLCMWHITNKLPLKVIYVKIYYLKSLYILFKININKTSYKCKSNYTTFTCEKFI